MNNLLWLKKGNEQVPSRFSLILQTDLKQAGCTLACSGRLMFTAVNVNYAPSPNTWKLPFMGKISMPAQTALMRTNSESLICTRVVYTSPPKLSAARDF